MYDPGRFKNGKRVDFPDQEPQASHSIWGDEDDNHDYDDFTHDNDLDDGFIHNGD